MTTTHNLGFPRIGARRELKHALESYWRNEIDRDALEQRGAELRARHWQLQADAGLNVLPVGDFSWYDGVLDTSLLFGVVPTRFPASDADADTAFHMARGRSRGRPDVAPCAMLKWFDTNYHYIVPEFTPAQDFQLNAERLLAEVREAHQAGHRIKPVLLGPVSYLVLGRTQDGSPALHLLDRLLPMYGSLLQQLGDAGCDWVQLDEPILVLDADPAIQQAYERAYHQLQGAGVRLMLTTYFGDLGDNLGTALNLPTDGLHLDLVRGGEQLTQVLDRLPPYKALSLGVVDGRNVWRTDLERCLDLLEPVRDRLGDRLWLAPSCSLLHCPVSLDGEDQLDAELRGWLAFASEKVHEVAILGKALSQSREAVAAALTENRRALRQRRQSDRTRNPAVRERLANPGHDLAQRGSPYVARAPRQQARLRLPLLPVTTIGSFPQTWEIRRCRRDWRRGRLDETSYRQRMEQEIRDTVARQEALGLDVLVHGEAERNDMVEHFGERLDGYAFTAYGWVQSYGSRCVKPPILYGDVARPEPITVGWAAFAQSLSARPMKGMLTGPVTMLQWSFVRDDLPRDQVCLQIALALRDEVTDLERAGLPIIQIDEPALREGLPLRQTGWKSYLDWAVNAFRVASSGVADDTQIHTHMCYSSFNDIIEAVAALDADVITIEATRSRMRLLDAFTEFAYPNAIGPGIYDIHSPRVPSTAEMQDLLQRALSVLPADRLWVNPDCGLKTRDWTEVENALANMVAAARRLRRDLGQQTALCDA